MRCLVTSIFLLVVGGMVTFMPASARAPDPAKDAPPGDEDAVSAETLGGLTMAVDPGYHTAKVMHALFTPDGKRLFTFSRDHSIRIWDAQSGEMRSVIRPPGVGPLGVVAMSHDGKLLAVAGEYFTDGKDKTGVIHLIRLPEGRIEHTLKGQRITPTALAFSQDGKHLAACCKDQVTLIWDIGTEKPKHTHKGGYLHTSCVAFSPDGSQLARSESGHAIEIIEVSTGKRAALLEAGEKKPCLSVAWSPDGKCLATNAPDGVRLWDTDGKLIEHVLKSQKVQAVLFSKDSKEIRVTWIDDKHHIQAGYIDRSGKPGATLKVHNLQARGDDLPVETGFLSLDGHRAVTTQARASIHQAYLWNTQDGSSLQKLTADGMLSGSIPVGWSSDGKSLAWQDGKSYRTFHLSNLGLGSELEQALVLGAITKLEGLTLERDLKLHDVAKVMKDGKEVWRVSLNNESVTSMTFIGKDRVALTGSRGGFFLYEIGTDKPIRSFLTTANACTYVAPSPDGKYLATACADDLPRIWSIDQNKPLLGLYVSGQDWIIWTPGYGYYAATPGGERLVGWTRDNGIDKLPTFYPAERFHKVLYRPEIIKLVLEKGSVEAALKETKASAVDIDTVLPPVARILSVEFDKQDKYKATVKVEVRAGRGQPIKATRLLLDGRSFPDGKFTEADLKDGAWADVPIPPGKHELKILVRGADSSDVSEPEWIETDLPDEQKPVMHVLAVGVNKYKTLKAQLDCPERDAIELLQAFRDANTGDLKRFREVKGETLLSEKATTDGILSALSSIRTESKAKPGDLVVLFFAGHGMRETVTRGGKPVPEFFLVTHEADPNDLDKTALSGTRLREALKEMPCQVLLILDACHSAGGIGNFVPITDDVTRSLTDDEAAVTVLAAALPHETAGELPGKNGRLTAALKAALRVDADTFFDHKEGIMHIAHVYAKVYDLVARESNGKQHPMLLSPWTMPPVVIRNVAEAK